MRRFAAVVPAILAAAAIAAPPTARQAAEDEAFVRALVAARLGPLVDEWRSQAGGDAALAARLDLARREIEVADDSPAARLAAIRPARRALVAAAIQSADPRRAAWAIDLAGDLLVAGPAIDGRVATLAVGIAPPEAVEAWRAELVEAEAALEAAREAVAATPRGPLALPAARAFRHGWEPRLEALGALAAATRALLEGRRPEPAEIEVPPEAEWNDLALVAALAAGPERLRALVADRSRGPWTALAAECASDRDATRLAERAVDLARAREPAMAMLAADAAVRTAAADDAGRFAPWEATLDATPEARRGPIRAAVLAKIASLPPTGELASMGELELAARSLAETVPEAIAAEVAGRPLALEGSPRAVARLLAFAQLRLRAARGELDGAAQLAERLVGRLGDDPIAAAAAETLVLVRAAQAAATTDPVPGAAERAALALAIERFPRHPRHDRWAIDLGLAELSARDPAAAVASLRRVPDGAALGPEARAVEAAALAEVGDAASIARAGEILKSATGDDPAVAARRSLANALLLARTGRGDEAGAAAIKVAIDPSFSMPIRADALRIALSLGAEPPADATPAILAAIPRARGSVVAALRSITESGSASPDRIRSLLDVLAPSRDSLRADELALVADATLATGDAASAARLAADALGAAPRGSEIALAAMLVRARALREIGGDGNLAEAFTLGRDVVRTAPQGSPRWWEANALQLEILEASGRNRDQVKPWVNRLRALDPRLGGGTTQVRIEAVAERAGRS